MATKAPEAKEAPAPAADKPSAPAAPSAPRFNLRAWLPALAALVLAPSGSWAIAEFALLPRLQKKLALPASAEAAPPAAVGAKGAKDGAAAAPPSYEFSNVVVNLAGTMGTRYLKTTFMVAGADAGLKAIFEENKARLTDVTLNVLSSLTLADLEEPGSKNVLREKLVVAYNQALGRKVADQVYFSDFVVQ